MGAYVGPDIVEDGLVFAMDAANTVSYISGSSKVYDLIDTNVTGSIINDVRPIGNPYNWEFGFDGVGMRIMPRWPGRWSGKS